MNGVFLLDKPAGMTSMRAVERCKRALGAKKAGHTGTLDPLATGVLAICLGRATRIAGYLLASSKTYRATMKLGVTTDTLDSDGTILEKREIPHSLTSEDVITCLHSFRGESQQIPPAFSALKVKGKRAYELARAGKTFELKARTIHVHLLETETTEIPEISFVCSVSKGTYIRSLIRDVGELLGCGAHMTGLRRLNVGEFSIQDSLSLEELQDAPEEGRKRIISMNEVLYRLPELELEEEELQRLQHGCVSHSMSRLEPKGEGAHRVSDQEGNLLALLQPIEEEWKIIRVFPLD